MDSIPWDYVSLYSIVMVRLHFQGQTDLLKKLFYKLDPAVVKGGFDVEYGQVKLAIKYASRQQLLLVKVSTYACTRILLNIYRLQLMYHCHARW